MNEIARRKYDHLKICSDENIESGSAGFENIQLVHKALPEVNFSEIDTSFRFLNKKLNFPLIIEAITGGTEKAEKINREIAQVAQEYGIGFGVGSERALIEDESTINTYYVRDIAPDIPIIGNIGAVQLNYGYTLEECLKAVDLINADALAFHLNPLQEVIQPEGNTNFSNITEKINEISSAFRKRKILVIAKEVGSGISYDVARGLDVDVIDTAGSGGTSWSLVESIRADKNSFGRAFSQWGIPTVKSLNEISKLKQERIKEGRALGIIASGGVRCGMDAAKCIALGADCTGIALPALSAYMKGGKFGLENFIENFIKEFKIAMFLTGSKKLEELRGKIQG